MNRALQINREKYMEAHFTTQVLCPSFFPLLLEDYNIHGNQRKKYNFSLRLNLSDLPT